MLPGEWGREMHGGNSYTNQGLGFAIRKPDGWTFIPPRWALRLLIGRVDPSGSGVDELARYAREPLFYFHYDHGLPDCALPTVCGSHREVAGIGAADRGTLLRMQVTQLDAVFEEFSLIEATADGLVSGRPANIIRSTFTTYSQAGGPLECLSRCYLVFAGDHMFCIEMTGPPAGEHCSEDEFRGILDTVRIG
jgi:hypothetical protein